MNYKQMLDKLAELEERVQKLERSQHSHPIPPMVPQPWPGQPPWHVTCNINPQDAFK